MLGETVSPSSKDRTFWLACSLISSLVLPIYGLSIALSERYVIQNDARQYVYLLHRFTDPEVFPADLIADYYTAVSPLVFQMVYALPAYIGIDPLFLNKILPLILGLIATWYCFHLCRELTPEPLVGFLACTLLNQNLWTREDLSSATPRAFVYPLFLAFCYFLVRKSNRMVIIVLGLQAVIFPPIALVSLVILVFEALSLQKAEESIKPPRKMRFQTHNLKMLSVGFVLLILVLGPYMWKLGEFGPVIHKAEASTLEAFGPNGSQPFFTSDRWKYWITGNHSGILPYGMRPPLILAGLFLPFLILRKREDRNAGLLLLLKIVLASVFLYVLAHLLLFRLYNPGRYTQHTFPVVMAIASGIVLTHILHHLFVWKRSIAWFCAVAGVAVILIQFQKVILHGYGYETYVKGKHARLYKFLEEQPKSIRIASLSQEADSLPAFAKRTTLVGREFLLPYHQAYYEKMKKRSVDLIHAQYSSDPAVLRTFLTSYQVDFVLVDQESLRPEWFDSQRWIHEFPEASRQVQRALQTGEVPAIFQWMDSCNALSSGNLVLLKSSCMLQSED